MGNLKEIKELSEGTIELLSAVGVEDLVALSQSEARGLQEEILQANGHLELLKDVPNEKEVGAWVKKARKITGKKPEPAVIRLVEEAPPLSSLPVALPIKKDQIVKSKISVSDVLVMEDFVEEGALSERIQAAKKTEVKDRTQKAKSKAKSSKKKQSEEKAQSAPAKERDAVPKKSNPLGIGEEQEEATEPRPVVKPLERNAGFDIRKTASPELNEGKKLHSRSYVRGVLHPQPGRVKLAAFVSFITLLLLPASFVAGGLVVFKNLVPISQPLWLLAFPVAFFFFGFLYLVIARPLKCRICGQPLLASKSCRRHVKAHRRFLLGYILPTSLHMMLFHWFRCIYCGTSVRLKE